MLRADGFPGASAAALESRQLWWTFAVVAAIAGLALLVYAPTVWKIAEAPDRLGHRPRLPFTGSCAREGSTRLHPGVVPRDPASEGRAIGGERRSDGLRRASSPSERLAHGPGRPPCRRPLGRPSPRLRDETPMGALDAQEATALRDARAPTRVRAQNREAPGGSWDR